LILNLEEAAIMTSTDYNDEKIFLKSSPSASGNQRDYQGQRRGGDYRGGKIYSAKLKSV